MSRSQTSVVENLEARELLSTVTISSAVTRQTIAGLGGNYAEAAFSTQVNDSVGQFTLTHLAPKQVRFAIPLNLWEPSPNASPGNLNSSSFQDTGNVHQIFLMLQQFQKEGANIVGAIWNLPNWMVSNPSNITYRLVPQSNFPALAEAITAFVKRARDVYGVKIAAVSMNEADGGYNTHLSSQDEDQLIKISGAQFAAAGLATKWVVGDVDAPADAVNYIAPILADPAVLPYIAAVGYHGWWSDYLGQSDFAAIATMANQYDLPVWATEASFEPANEYTPAGWANARYAAQLDYKMIAWSEASVVDYWEYQDDFALVSPTGAPYATYYVVQQMADALAPGAQVVASSSNDSNLLPIAAKGPVAGEFTVQTQNLNTASTQVTYQGLPNGQYTLMSTTSSQNEVVEGTYKVTNGTATVSLPADSLNTLTNTPSTLPQTPVNVTVSPGSGTFKPGQIVHFSAVATDQTNKPLAPQPQFTWSLDPGSAGSINSATGLYTAPLTGGSAIIRATDGNFSGTSSVFTTPVASALPSGWSDHDIGSPGQSGLASFDGNNWGVSGGGADIWGSSDQFNFASTAIAGDTTLVARVTSLSNTDPWAKAGVMLRGSTDSWSSFAAVVATESNGMEFEWRSSPGAQAQSFAVSISPAIGDWVKIVRSGSGFSGFYSTDGVNWIQLGSAQTIAMPKTLLGGLAVTAHNNSLLTTATFANVSDSAVASPAPIAVPPVEAPPLASPPAANVLPASWTDGDIGGPGVAGSFTASSNGSNLTVAGGGSDIWNTSDQFNFARQTLNGDATLVAKLSGISNTDPWAKAGLMIRNDASAASAFADIVATSANGVSFQWRTASGAPCGYLQAPGVPAPTAASPVWLMLVRSGNSLSGYYSRDGVNWTQVGATKSIAMSAAALGGLAVTSHNNAKLNTASFTNVSLSATAALPTASSSAGAVPAGWTDGDIGSPALVGSASVNGSVWTVTGGGADIWGASDQFNFASKNITGDDTLTAEVTSLSNSDPWAKAGLMLRDGTSPNAAYVDVVATPSNGVSLQWRSAAGAQSNYVDVGGVASGPVYLKLVRAGSASDQFSAYYSLNGSNWVQIGSTLTVDMSSAVLGGLAVTAHNNAAETTATFMNVAA